MKLSNNVNPNWDTTALVTSNTKPFPPPGSNFNISMSQQGFTAVAVNCSYQQLDAETDPPLQRFADPVEITSGGKLTSYTAVLVATTCANGQTIQYGKSSVAHL